jgi:N-acyl homoserine lactone hydrolase
MTQIIQPTVFQNITTIVKVSGKDVKVHALCTGMVAVKTAFRARKGSGAIAKINILLDQQFTEYMPIWVWIIEHPEGVIAIDTGETVKAKDRKNYLANESAYSRYISQRTSKFIIEQEDELNQQLSKINFKPQNIDLVILTHLHLDHTDGLRFFPKTEIIVNQFEYDHPYANLPTTYPSWFKPKLVNYKEDRIEVFGKAFPITKAEDVLYIPTPGHTNGHSSVVLKTDDVDIIFAGDTSYYQDQLLKDEIAGVNKDFTKTRETYRKFMNYASLRPTVYLPSHDVNSGKRLLNKTLLKV